MEGGEIEKLKKNAVDLANIVGRQPVAMKNLMSKIYEEDILEKMREVRYNSDVIKWVIEFKDISAVK